MRKNIFIVRHCEAQGQSVDAQLTETGRQQAIDLSGFFANMKIDRIISSPFQRAVASVKPLSEKINIHIEADERLPERILSLENLPDWLDHLKASFTDMDLKLAGGESSRQAMRRIADVTEEAFHSEVNNTLIVTHGNIMSLLLKHFDDQFGFLSWQNLTNPDVYLLGKTNHSITVKRIWQQDW